MTKKLIDSDTNRKPYFKVSNKKAKQAAIDDMKQLNIRYSIFIAYEKFIRTYREVIISI